MNVVRSLFISCAVCCSKCIDEIRTVSINMSSVVKSGLRCLVPNFEG